MPSPIEIRPTPTSASQRLIATVLRNAMRALFKPVMGRVSYSTQRRWMRVLASSTLSASNVPSHHESIANVPCQVFRPLNADNTVLFLHGGGYVAGAPATHRAITSHMAHYANAQVIVPDYRLAPEHPCPAAIDDAVAVYQQILAQGVAPSRLTIMGDSAGGGLTLATLQALQQQGIPLPACAILISPWVDLSMQDTHATSRDVLLSREWLDDAAQCYVGSARDNPQGSPLFGTLTELPPIFIQTGSDEILLNDTHRLHAALTEAGNAVECHIHEARWHDFQVHTGALRDANDALMTCARFIQKNVKVTTP